MRARENRVGNGNNATKRMNKSVLCQRDFRHFSSILLLSLHLTIIVLHDTILIFFPGRTGSKFGNANKKKLSRSKDTAVLRGDVCYCKGKEIQARESHGRILPCDKTHIIQKWVVLNIGHSFGLFRFDIVQTGYADFEFSCV